MDHPSTSRRHVGQSHIEPSVNSVKTVEEYPLSSVETFASAIPPLVCALERVRKGVSSGSRPSLYSASLIQVETPSVPGIRPPSA